MKTFNTQFIIEIILYARDYIKNKLETFNVSKARSWSVETISKRIMNWTPIVLHCVLSKILEINSKANGDQLSFIVS